MHNPGSGDRNHSGPVQEQQREQQIQASSYNEDFMNLDDNLFGLDSDGRDLIFVYEGRTAMNDANNNQSQHYDTSPMQTDNNDLNNILGQMPTPVSNNIRASSDSNTFMSPLQVDQQSGYDRINGVQYNSQPNEEMFFTPLLSPAVTPMDVIRLSDNENLVPGVDHAYFSPLTSPALERFPASDARRTQSMVGLSNLPPNRRSAENVTEAHRNVRRAPFSPINRPSQSRKRNSITSLNLNVTNGSHSESSESVSPEPHLPSSSMPPPPPRNSSSSKLNDKGSTNGRPHKSSRQKRGDAANPDLAPATPASFLNMTLQHSDPRQQHGNHMHVESTLTYDHHSSDTSPPTVRSAGSTPTFGPISAGPSMGSPSFISIPSSYDPNNSATTPNLNATNNNNVRRPLRNSSRAQSRSSSSSPAFKPIISPNLKPLLPGGTSSDVIHTLASKSNYQNILEGNHSQLGLSYPKELSSGIESRRTSHKVAEQARRSRINNAIDQLGAMLPGETDGNSKAITVEKAIEYIKSLEDQLAKAKAELGTKN